MNLADYFKQPPSELVLVSNDVLKGQQSIIEKYEELLNSKDAQIAILTTQRDLALSQKGGLEIRVKKLTRELEFYTDLPRIDTRI